MRRWLTSKSGKKLKPHGKEDRRGRKSYCKLTYRKDLPLVTYRMEASGRIYEKGTILKIVSDHRGRRLARGKALTLGTQLLIATPNGEREGIIRFKKPLIAELL